MTLLAYLDPGSTSMIVGALASGAAGVVVAAKSVRHRISSPFRKKSPADLPDSDSDETAQEVADS